MTPKVGKMVHSYTGKTYEVVEGTCGICAARRDTELCSDLPECVSTRPGVPTIAYILCPTYEKNT